MNNASAKFRAFHHVNGTVLILFIALHMLTHLSGLFGIEAYQSTQSTLRYLYRNTVVEPVLLLSFGLQITIGAYLFVKTFKRRMAERWARAQAISGAIFLFFITQHLIALCFTRWVEGLDTTFFWPASVMSRPPFYWYFAPYYFLGISAMFVHLACAGRLTFLRQRQPNAARRVFWVTTCSGILIALAVDLMLLGAFYDITLPDQWTAYRSKLIPGSGS